MHSLGRTLQLIYNETRCAAYRPYAHIYIHAQPHWRAACSTTPCWDALQVLENVGLSAASAYDRRFIHLADATHAVLCVALSQSCLKAILCCICARLYKRDLPIHVYTMCRKFLSSEVLYSGCRKRVEVSDAGLMWRRKDFTRQHASAAYVRPCRLISNLLPVERQGLTLD